MQYFYNQEKFTLNPTVYSKTTQQQPPKNNPNTLTNATPGSPEMKSAQSASKVEKKINQRQAKNKKKNLEKS